MYPSKEQIARVERWDHALRFLWNLSNEQRYFALGRCHGDRKYPSFYDQAHELTELRNMADLDLNVWLADVPQHACQQVLKNLDLAWQRWFKRLGSQPQFKTKNRDHLSIHEFDVANCKIEPSHIKFSKIGWIYTRFHRKIEGKVTSFTITRDLDEWYISIQTEIEIPDPVPSTKSAVGIDRGVIKLIADSDGRFVDNPHHLDNMQPQIRRAQRQAASKKKGSKNQKKAYDKLAKKHQKVRRQREHLLHTESKRYAENQGIIALESLSIKNMSASAAGTTENPGVNVSQKRGLNRAIRSMGWYKFELFLKYKVEPLGGRVVMVDPRYTSQICSECGTKDPASRRTQADFNCTNCGALLHADTNAAKNILVRGLNVLAAESAAAVCGGSVIGHPPKQKLRVVRRKAKSARNR